MCFYTQRVWSCGYWRWDKFREQCKDETRMGETCGLKLVYETVKISAPCGICDDIVKKQRKIVKMDGDLDRWVREGNKPYTIEKALVERKEAVDKIKTLQSRHSRDMNTLSATSKRVPRTRGNKGVAAAAAAAAAAATPRPLSPGTSLPVGGTTGAADAWAAAAPVQQVTTPTGDASVDGTGQPHWDGQQLQVQTPSPPYSTEGTLHAPPDTLHAHIINTHYHGQEPPHYDDGQGPVYSVYQAHGAAGQGQHQHQHQHQPPHYHHAPQQYYHQHTDGGYVPPHEIQYAPQYAAPDPYAVDCASYGQVQRPEGPYQPPQYPAYPQAPRPSTDSGCFPEGCEPYALAPTPPTAEAAYQGYTPAGSQDQRQPEGYDQIGYAYSAYPRVQYPGYTGEYQQEGYPGYSPAGQGQQGAGGYQR